MLPVIMRSIEQKCSSHFELINTFVLVNSDILLERERERERERDAGVHLYLARARQDKHFYLNKKQPLSFFSIVCDFNILQKGKILKQIAVSIPLRAKRVYSLPKYSVYSSNKLILK